MWPGFGIPAQCFLSINEIEKRRSLSRAQLTVAGDQVSVAADVDHEIYVVKISRIFVLSLHHSMGVELLEPTPGLPDNPYLDNLHAYACLGFQGHPHRLNSWDIRCWTTAPQA